MNTDKEEVGRGLGSPQAWRPIGKLIRIVVCCVYHIGDSTTTTDKGALWEVQRSKLIIPNRSSS